MKKRLSIIPQNRITILAVIAIFIPALVLVVLGMRTIIRQRLLTEHLVTENYRNVITSVVTRIKEEMLIFEKQVKNRLSSLELARLSPGELNTIFREIISQDPIVEQIFYIDAEGEVLFPPAATRKIHPVETIESLGGNTDFADWLRQANFLEFTKENPTDAIFYYEKCLSAVRSGYLGAEAANGIARCQFKLGKLHEALKSYQLLLGNYHGQILAGGSSVDLLARWQIAVIMLRLKQEYESAEFLIRFYADILENKFYAETQEIDYYKSRISDIFNEIVKSVSLPETMNNNYRLLVEQDLVRQEEEQFRSDMEKWISLRMRLDTPGNRTSGIKLRYLSETIGGVPYLLAYTLVSVPDSHNKFGLVGFKVSLDYIKNSIFPVGLGQFIQIVTILDEKDAPVFAYPYYSGTKGWLLVRRLDEPLSFWKTAISADALTPIRTASNRQVFFYMGLVGLMLIALATGTVLVIRGVNKEMELARMRTEFVSRVSHELRTPLSLIRMFGETLEMERTTSEEKRKEYSRIITKESERLTHLINNVLDFSKIEANKKEYYFEYTDIRKIVNETVEAYRYHIEKRGFVLEIHISENLPVSLIDKDAVSQALLNLLSNAVKYSAEQKKIAVNARTNDSWVIIEVIDHGIGISLKEQEKIFRKFYRVKDPRVEQTGGSGLGLTLVKHIAEAHGGRIEVESTPGKGSKFSLVLPVKRKDSK